MNPPTRSGPASRSARGIAALARAVVYATFFVAFVLVFLPARVLERAGVMQPPVFGAAQLTGAVITLLGAALVVWCVVTFALIGRGTPAPFDPPRDLVVAGPYARVRNPMYIGADMALAGAAVYYGSAALMLYLLGFAAVTHLFVVLYEEPTLSRLFGPSYTDYRARVNRWLPKRAKPLPPAADA